MAAPSINESFEVVSHASGAAFSQTFTATGTVTGWSVSGIAALEMGAATGVLEGVPSVSVATVYTVTVTATNDDGSDSIEFQLLVSPTAVGGTQDDFGDEVDFDLLTRQLVIPGIGSPAPSTEPSEEGADAAENFLMMVTSGERLDLLFGLSKRGVLQDIDIDEIILTLKRFETDEAITVSQDVPTELGSGNGDRRYRVPVYFDESELDPFLEQATGLERTFVDFYFRAQILKKDDASDFESAVASSTISTLTQGQTETDSFAITLTEELSSALYQLTITLVVPGDTNLNITLTRTMRVTWDETDYAVASIEGSATGAGESTTEADWDTALENTSVTGTGTGLTVATSLTTSAQTDGKFLLVLPLENWTVQDDGFGGLILQASSTETWSLYDSGDSLLYEWNPNDNDTEGDVGSDIGTGLSETVTATFTESGNLVTLLFPADTDVVKAKFNASTPVVDAIPNPDGPSYADAVVSAQVIGLVDPTRALSKQSVSSKVRVYSHD